MISPWLEGTARDLARAINDVRKARDLALSDRIAVRLVASGPVAEAARRHGAWIASEVLAVSWDVDDDGAADADGAALDLDGHTAAVNLEVADAR